MFLLAYIICESEDIDVAILDLARGQPHFMFEQKP